MGDRRCGQCNACCIVMDTTAADPDAHAFRACKHVCEKGCAIYDDRPEFCRTYRCGWLQGHLPAADRPDRVGLIVEVQKTVFGDTFVVHEFRPRAMDLPRGARIYDRLRRTGKPVVVMRTDGSRAGVNIEGTPEVVRALRAAANAGKLSSPEKPGGER